MSWKSTTALFGIKKNLWAKEIHQGAHRLSTRQGAHLPISWAPWTSTDPNSNSISTYSGRKNQGEGFIMFYDMEPPPSRNLSRVG